MHTKTVILKLVALTRAWWLRLGTELHMQNYKGKFLNCETCSTDTNRDDIPLRLTVLWEWPPFAADTTWPATVRLCGDRSCTRYGGGTASTTCGTTWATASRRPPHSRRSAARPSGRAAWRGRSSDTRMLSCYRLDSARWCCWALTRKCSRNEAAIIGVVNIVIFGIRNNSKNNSNNVCSG